MKGKSLRTRYFLFFFADVWLLSTRLVSATGRFALARAGDGPALAACFFLPADALGFAGAVVRLSFLTPSLSISSSARRLKDIIRPFRLMISNSAL